MESIHLAYLIEVAIILNFALRELNIKDLTSIRTKTENQIKSINKSDSITGNYVKNCSKRLQALIYGESSYTEDGSKVKVWDSNYLRICYKWVTTKKALIFSAISIITNIIVLYVIVVFHAEEWFYWFLLLITITIMHPLILLFSSNKIKDFLLGRDGEDGKIKKLTVNLEKSVKEKEESEENEERTKYKILKRGKVK